MSYAFTTTNKTRLPHQFTGNQGVVNGAFCFVALRPHLLAGLARAFSGCAPFLSFLVRRFPNTILGGMLYLLAALRLFSGFSFFVCLLSRGGTGLALLQKSIRHSSVRIKLSFRLYSEALIAGFHASII